MTEQDKKAPLAEFKDGAVTVKLWEQKAGDQTYVNASIGKWYKNNETGQFKESRSFNGNDLLKLQMMLPEVRREIQYLQEQQRSNNPQKEQRENQSERSNNSQQERQENNVERSNSMSVRRNSVMQEANRDDGVKSTRQPVRNPTQDRSR
jgi:hypothetical protein